MVMLVITVMTWQFIDMFHWLRSSSKPSPRVDDLCAERGMFSLRSGFSFQEFSKSNVSWFRFQDRCQSIQLYLVLLLRPMAWRNASLSERRDLKRKTKMLNRQESTIAGYIVYIPTGQVSLIRSKWSNNSHHTGTSNNEQSWQKFALGQ